MKWGKKIMKNRALKIGSIGTFVIALLIVSSSTALTTTQNQVKNQEKTMHIDSNIKITKKYEQKLMDASKIVDDPDFKILLEKIIDLLQTKKVVNSGDIQKIIQDNDLVVSGVYSSKDFHIARGISTNGMWGYCAGDCGLKPIGIIPYVGGIIYWHARASSWSYVGVNVNIGPYTYTYDHNGLVIGYFGFGTNDWTYDMTYGLRTRFMMGGVGFLIFISS
jgi:hypothetical protein